MLTYEANISVVRDLVGLINLYAQIVSQHTEAIIDVADTRSDVDMLTVSRASLDLVDTLESLESLIKRIDLAIKISLEGD